MANHTEFLELAQELISEEGREITVELLSAGPVEADKPWRGEATPTVEDSEVLFGVFIDPQMGKELVSDDLLARAEQLCLVAPGTKDLTFFQSITDESSRWKVVFNRILKPADLTLLYIFGLKR